MKRHLLPLVAVLVALTIPLHAKDAAPKNVPKDTGYFPAGTSFNAAALLPNPPAPDSLEFEKEIEFILAKQATRTDADVARIKQEENYSVYLLENVVGAWFSVENAAATPKLTALLEKVSDTARPLVMQAKDTWKRPRPFLENSRIIPSLVRPKDFAYPSGHTTRAVLDALVLSAVMPDINSPLMMRAYQIGDDRVIAGVDYPSDNFAGKKLGQAIFDQLMAMPDFKTDLAAAKAEVKAYRTKMQ